VCFSSISREYMTSPAAAINEQGIALANRREFAAAADCFRRAVAADPKFVPAHRNLGLALSELGDLVGAVQAYGRALKLDPQAADVHNNVGIAISRLGDDEKAVTYFERALAIQPNYGGAFNNLGIALANLHRDGHAVAAFRRAIQLAPEQADAYNNLGLALTRLGKFRDAIEAYQQALRLQPNYAEAHSNLGIALTDIGQFDEALAHYRTAIELDPQNPEPHTNRAVCLFLQGDWPEAWREYEWRLHNPKHVRVKHDSPQWDGSPLAGRTLLLEAEQGMGDTIQFIRYAAEIKRQHEGRVIVACEAPLVPLLTGVAGIDVLQSQKDDRPMFDVWSPLLSLPGLLRHDPATFPAQVPYLHAESARVDKWKSRLAVVRGLKIGIVWQGNKWNTTDRRRSFPLGAMTPLGKLAGVNLISLQKGDGREQLEAVADFDVVSLGDDFDSSGGAFLDSAAVMKNLDLVITADTSLAHLAGALGVPMWLALSQVPDWRWGMSGDRSPWYPTMRIFRQTELGDWTGVFQQMATAILAEHPELRFKRPEEFRLAGSGFNRLARTRHGLMLSNRNDTYVGRSLAELGEFSEGEAELFRQIVRPGMTVVEAGANIGAHTIVLARLVGEAGYVHAIEPQRLVFQTLAGNVALNSLANVRCYQAAAGEQLGSIVVPMLDVKSPNNFGGLGLGAHELGERVPVMTVDSLKLPQCGILKIDVEGMELAVIRGAADTIRRCKPILYVENDRAERSPALIEAILALGYKLYWHLPPYYAAGNYYGNATNVFGDMVSLNMLGIHASVPTNIQGLRPVDGPQSDWRVKAGGTPTPRG
jgi:FkbM family methyltransferase